MCYKSLKNKLIFIFILLTLFALGSTYLIFYHRYLRLLKEDLKEHLLPIATLSAKMINPEELAAIPLDPSGINHPAYLKIKKQLQEIKELHPNIRYIYIMSPAPKKGYTRFLVDASPPQPEELSRGLRNWPGDEYNATKYPYLFAGFWQPSVDQDFLTDEWGAVFSAYAPIKDKENKAFAVLGVDMDVSEVGLILLRIKKEIFLSLLIGILIAALLGSLFSHIISSPINKLIKEMRYITKTADLQHKIILNTGDELEELAKNFNHLTKTLYELHSQHRQIVLDVIQSLTLAIEANAPYMNGHSQRVTKLSSLVAEKMNLAEKEIEIIKEMGLVHDIGKLGIDSRVLTKEGPLTEEEWKEIKRHPIEGERILTPLMFVEPELSLVRSHHERYDGSGYPDGLKGEQISIIVSILSLCDAYDAMTSERPYRKRPFSKEEAINEIKRCCGKQFHPKVVEAFLALYAENKL